MSAPDAPVLVEMASDGVALITLNRPDHGNGVVVELAHALLAVLIQDSVRGQVTTVSHHGIVVSCFLDLFPAPVRLVVIVRGVGEVSVRLAFDECRAVARSCARTLGLPALRIRATTTSSAPPMSPASSGTRVRRWPGPRSGYTLA